MQHTMLSEIDYIPFMISELPEGPWLVLAPHADDESFGMGGSILLAKKTNIAVDVVIMTDGALGGDKEVREREARDACAMLGVKDVSFLAEMDRTLYANEKTVGAVASMLREKNIKSLFFPHPMEPHPDHRATAMIGWEALRESGFWANGYSYEVSTQGVVNMAIDITGVVEEKKSVMQVYNSQLLQNNYIDVIIALNRSRTWSLGEEVLYAEVFYKYSPENKNLGLVFLDMMKKFSAKEALVYKARGGFSWLRKIWYR